MVIDYLWAPFPRSWDGALPLKGQRESVGSQKKEIYGMYVSIVFSFPVWLKQIISQPLIFLLKHRKYFLEKETLCKKMKPIKWIIMMSSLPSFSFHGVVSMVTFISTLYIYNPLALKYLFKFLPWFLLTDLRHKIFKEKKKEIKAQTMWKNIECYNSELWKDFYSYLSNFQCWRPDRIL